MNAHVIEVKKTIVGFSNITVYYAECSCGWYWSNRRTIAMANQDMNYHAMAVAK